MHISPNFTYTLTNLYSYFKMFKKFRIEKCFVLKLLIFMWEKFEVLSNGFLNLTFIKNKQTNMWFRVTLDTVLCPLQGPKEHFTGSTYMQLCLPFSPSWQVRNQLNRSHLTVDLLRIRTCQVPYTNYIFDTPDSRLTVFWVFLEGVLKLF